MSKNTIWVGAALIALLVGLLVWFANSSTTTVVTVPPTANEVWGGFKKDYKCEEVAVSATTSVIVFSQEGATTTAGTHQVFKCKGGSLFVF